MILVSRPSYSCNSSKLTIYGTSALNIDDEGCVVRVAEIENAEAGEEVLVLPEPEQELGAWSSIEEGKSAFGYQWCCLLGAPSVIKEVGSNNLLRTV